MSGFDSAEFMRLVDAAAQVIAEKDVAAEKARADQWMRLGRKYDDIRDSIRSCPDTPEGHTEFYEQSATIIFGPNDEGSGT